MAAVWLLAGLTGCERGPYSFWLALPEGLELPPGVLLEFEGRPVGELEPANGEEDKISGRARVVITSETFQPLETDQFEIGAEGLIGGAFYVAVRRFPPGQAGEKVLPRGAVVNAAVAPGLEWRGMFERVVRSVDDSLAILQEVSDLPEPERSEVLKKIRRLVEEAKREAARRPQQ